MRLQVKEPTGDRSRGVSVWVDTADDDQAVSSALAALQQAGWQSIANAVVLETQAEDYFRSCPSQQAYSRAQQQGIAWRFDEANAD